LAELLPRPADADGWIVPKAPPAAPQAWGARRPVQRRDVSIRTPLAFVSDPVVPDDIAVVIHCYYPDVAVELLRAAQSIPARYSLYLSTDTADKRDALASISREVGGPVPDIRILPNRGRDIAPKLVGFRDVYERHAYFLHLHTKGSLHDAGLAGWRTHLVRNLVGSTATVQSAFALLSRERIGIVFPQHYPPIWPALNWGSDFDLVRDLVARCGGAVSRNSKLEFPSGSMYWGRSAAIRPLLDQNLAFEDFPAEGGQIGGTLAHAIERSILFVAETAGFRWAKINDGLGYPWPDTLMEPGRPEDLAPLLERFPRLLSVAS